MNVSRVCSWTGLGSLSPVLFFAVKCSSLLLAHELFLHCSGFFTCLLLRCSFQRFPWPRATVQAAVVGPHRCKRFGKKRGHLRPPRAEEKQRVDLESVLFHGGVLFPKVSRSGG